MKSKARKSDTGDGGQIRRVLRYASTQPWLDRGVQLPLPPILTPKDVAALFGQVSRSTITRWRQKGYLKGARRVGGRFFFVTSELIAGLEEQPVVD